MARTSAWARVGTANLGRLSTGTSVTCSSTKRALSQQDRVALESDLAAKFGIDLDIEISGNVSNGTDSLYNTAVTVNTSPDGGKTLVPVQTVYSDTSATTSPT